MPVYVYRLPDGSTVEVQQDISDEALCQYRTVSGTLVPVHRVYSAPAVVLKGKGFYRNGG